MKRTIFILFLLLFPNLFYGQEVLMQVAKNYFRSDPFIGEFSLFLTHLMNDPTLQNKSIHKRTDTSFFYFSGDYTTHQPFSFKTKRTHVVLAEMGITTNDSLPPDNTIITYQLAGYTEGGKEGEVDVKKEFERFDRKYLKKFSKNEYSEIKQSDEITGGIKNYFTYFSPLSPLSVAWQKIGIPYENVFVITLRFKVSGNIAVLPIPSDSP